MGVERSWQRDLRMGVCPTHGTPMNEVCGEYVCGTCYGQKLEREPMPRMQQVSGMETVYSPDKHMMVTRKAKQQGG